MSEVITYDEWRDELERAIPQSATDAVTLTEICDATGMWRNAVAARIRAGMKAGTVECIRVRRPRIDGLMALVPAYRFIRKSEE